MTSTLDPPVGLELVRSITILSKLRPPSQPRSLGSSWHALQRLPFFRSLGSRNNSVPFVRENGQFLLVVRLGLGRTQKCVPFRETIVVPPRYILFPASVYLAKASLPIVNVANAVKGPSSSIIDWFFLDQTAFQAWKRQFVSNYPYMIS